MKKEMYRVHSWTLAKSLTPGSTLWSRPLATHL